MSRTHNCKRQLDLIADMLREQGVDIPQEYTQAARAFSQHRGLTHASRQAQKPQITEMVRQLGLVLSDTDNMPRQAKQALFRALLRIANYSTGKVLGGESRPATSEQELDAQLLLADQGVVVTDATGTPLPVRDFTSVNYRELGLGSMIDANIRAARNYAKADARIIESQHHLKLARQLTLIGKTIVAVSQDKGLAAFVAQHLDAAQSSKNASFHLNLVVDALQKQIYTSAVSKFSGSHHSEMTQSLMQIRDYLKGRTKSYSPDKIDKKILRVATGVNAKLKGHPLDAAIASAKTMKDERSVQKQQMKSAKKMRGAHEGIFQRSPAKTMFRQLAKLKSLVCAHTPSLRLEQKINVRFASAVQAYKAIKGHDKAGRTARKSALKSMIEAIDEPIKAAASAEVKLAQQEGRKPQPPVVFSRDGHQHAKIASTINNLLSSMMHYANGDVGGTSYASDFGSGAQEMNTGRLASVIERADNSVKQIIMEYKLDEISRGALESEELSEPTPPTGGPSGP